VCRDRVQSDWLVCPNCRTRLHRICPSCNRLADPHWPLCAYCGHEFQRAPARQPEPAAQRGAAAATVAERGTEVTAEHGGLRRPANS
jgi:hypothetical protein